MRSIRFWLGSVALVVACDKSNSLGEVSDGDGGDDEGETEGAEDSGDEDGDGDDGDGGDGATSVADGDDGDDGDDGADDGDSGEPDECPPGFERHGPASCPVLDGTPQVPEEGCYAPCENPGGLCDDGSACLTVQVDPCPCPPDAEACCGACAASMDLCMPTGFDAACEALRGNRFESIEEYECGLSKEGPVLCHWSVEFGIADDYLWTYSDVGEGSTYTCENGVIDPASDIEASYDLATTILLWDGIEYALVPGT